MRAWKDLPSFYEPDDPVDPNENAENETGDQETPEKGIRIPDRVGRSGFFTFLE